MRRSSLRGLRATRLISAILLASFVIGAAGTAQGASKDVTFKHKVPYVDDGNPHHVMDVYIPPGDGPFPGVVVIHGGGWKSGSVAKFAQEARYLAEHGFVAFAITYRLAPEFHYPAQVEDVQASVRYIRSHASDFKVNPKEIGALGGSAGAHLAAMLGTVGEGSGDRGSRVNVVVSWSAPFDLTIAAQRGAIAHPESKNRPVELFLGCSLEQCPDTYQEASPINHVDPTDAPMFIANATLDETSIAGAQEMNDRLQKAGIPTKLAIPQCRCHSDAYEFMTAPELGGKTVFDASIDFLNQWKDGHAAPPPPTTGSPSPTETTTPPPGTSAFGRLWPLAVIGLVVIAALILGLAARRRRL
jgi:acetyl esterase/lipase